MNQELAVSRFMQRPLKLFLLFFLIIIISLACNMPGFLSDQGQENPSGFVETSVAETMTALEGNGNTTGESPESLPPSETAQPEITDTPTITLTITETPTPEVAMVFVSKNTNCRVGQGTDFQWLVTLLAGAEAEIVGVDTSGEYWYIRRPDQAAGFCWLWGEYATPTGPYHSLPVYTPIPTATPGFDFQINFQQSINCGILWGMQYQIVNNGSFTLESWRTTATDHTGGLTNVPNEQNSFFDYTGCVVAGEQVVLTPGEAYYLNVVFDNDPSGHDITAKIKICTEDDLGGECLEKEIRHTP